ncbi:MAG: TauD/TfdA family dioxygenase [Rhodospirillaceae bacterium]|nr:TauD/TfdA family dioxygenase [Rhodospirillaceae bacterium]MBT6137744.1 TauD/TfdA family dioxygenase [Rhodospirillaceae bacterium]
MSDTSLASANDELPPAIELPGGWQSADLDADQRWIAELDDLDRGEILSAFQSVRHLSTSEIDRDSFKAPRLAAKLSGFAEELENGFGVSLLRGVPVEGLNDDDARGLCWALGTQFAPALQQNRKGDLIFPVRDDAGGRQQDHSERIGELDALTSFSRARSNGPLRFHTDGADALSLLCVRSAASGGGNKLASSVHVHNEILRRRPDLHALLCQDYYRTYESDVPGGSQDYYRLPVFTRVGDKFSSQYSRTYVEEAQRLGAPKMTAAQDEALDLLAEIAEESCLRFRLEPGDLVFFNNHTCYHGRDPYDDDASSAQDRLLYRLWFAPPNSRPLAPAYAKIWNAIDPGVLRCRNVEPAAVRKIPRP